VPAQRVGAGLGLADPVGVVPAQRREPGVEPCGGDLGPAHADVARQHPGQPADQRPAGRYVGAPRGSSPQLVRQVDVSDLVPRVHPRVGAPGHDQPRDVWKAQHPGEGLGQESLDRPLRRLGRPPGERRPVVPEVQAHAHEPAVPLTGGGGFVVRDRLDQALPSVDSSMAAVASSSAMSAAASA